MKLPSIQQVIQDSTRTLIRFPLVLFNAALGTVTALILVDYEGPPGPTVLFNILFATILGIPFWIAVALLVEKKKMGRRYSFVAPCKSVSSIARAQSQFKHENKAAYGFLKDTVGKPARGVR